MKNLKMYFPALTLTIILGCKKPEPKIVQLPEPSDSSKLEMIWKLPLSENLQSSSSVNPLYASGKVIFSAIRSNSVAFVGLNGTDGNLKWQWNDFLGNVGLHGSNLTFLYQNLLIYNHWSENGVVDINTGSALWTQKIPANNGDPRITLIDDHIYHKRIYPATLRPDSLQLVRTSVHSPGWETVFTLYRDSLNGYTPSIEGPSLWIAPNGDSVLVFQNRSWNFDTSDGQIDFYAYNLSTKKVQFVLEDMEPSGNSNVATPLVDGNYAYFLGARSVSCIDLITGSMVWQKLFYGDGAQALTSNLLVVGNKLIVKQDNNLLTAFDKLTGGVDWEQLDAGYTPSHMEYFDGVIYYTADGDGKLYAVNADNGKIIWKEDSPNEGEVPAGFNGGVAIDPVNRYLFVADRYYAMAFKLPER